MPKVTMLKTTPGSVDGIHVVTYKEGETYEISDNLAKAFVDEMKVAEYPGRRMQSTTAAPTREAKMETAAPENKSQPPAEPARADVVVEPAVPTKSPVRGASPRRG